LTKRIAVFTSIRSEYGILTPILREINRASDFKLELIVAGAHLSKLHGYTISHIINDGFSIYKKINFLKYENGRINLQKSLAKLTQDIGRYFELEKPNLLIVMGDRFELMPVVTMALLYNIPIAHLSGGDITLGSIDNQIRNAITKISNIHYVTNDIAMRNLLKMNEERWRIFNVGEPCLDIIDNLITIDKAQLYKEYSLLLSKKLIIATFHPETIDNQITAELISNLFQEIIKNDEFQILVTSSNFDKDGDEINECLHNLSKSFNNIKFTYNLGQIKYYSFLKHCDLVIGNSSSGIIEVQSFNKPVVNIGKRQEGRLCNANVYNVKPIVIDILKAINYVMKDDFKKKYLYKKNKYGDGNTAHQIINSLKKLNWEKLLVK